VKKLDIAIHPDESDIYQSNNTLRKNAGVWRKSSVLRMRYLRRGNPHGCVKGFELGEAISSMSIEFHMFASKGYSFFELEVPGEDCRIAFLSIVEAARRTMAPTIFTPKPDMPIADLDLGIKELTVKASLQNLPGLIGVLLVGRGGGHWRGDASGSNGAGQRHGIYALHTLVTRCKLKYNCN
jgi:hypothetical protein